MGMGMIAAFWQGLESDSISAGNTKWLMIFVGICALSMLSQAIIFAFMAIGAKKTQQRVLLIAEELRARSIPVLDKAEDLFAETIPKMKTMTQNLLETSEIVRAKAQEIDGTLTDANLRAKQQIARVDGMVSTGLTATGALAEMIHQGVRRPIVEVVGLVNGFKAGMNVLMSKSKQITRYGRGPEI